MPVYTFGGQSVAIPSAEDIAREVGIAQREAARGWKHMSLPVLSGTIASAAITLGVTKGQLPVGPESGYVWSLRRLIVTGLATGATPDVVNLYKNDAFSGPPLWQLNGNNFGYTFGFGELVIKSGETLALQNSGSLTATGLVTLSGELDEAPAEKYYAGRT